jgi:CheY-like chemotaxis protein
VLIADDNAINSMVLARLLSGMGCDVSTVADGAAAIDTFDAAPFDLIVLDLHMPHHDGTEVVRHIRQAEAEQGGAAHMVVALTADVLEDTRRRCLAAGFTEFLTKPVRKEIIAELVARAAALKESRRR